MSTTQTTAPDAVEGSSPDPVATGAQRGETAPVEVEVLVEEISIDGMCGVY